MVVSYESGKGRLTCPPPATSGRMPALGTTFQDSVRVMFLLALRTRQMAVSQSHYVSSPTECAHLCVSFIYLAENILVKECVEYKGQDL